MKSVEKINIANAVLAFLLVFLIWVPITRQFMIGSEFGDVFTLMVSVVLLVSSVFALLKTKSRLEVATLIISMSPIIFIALTAVLYYYHPVP